MGNNLANIVAYTIGYYLIISLAGVFASYITKVREDELPTETTEYINWKIVLGCIIMALIEVL